MRHPAIAAAIAVAVLGCAMVIQAAPVGDAVQRPALRVAQPGRVALMSAALAGPRIVAVGERGVVAISTDQATTWRQVPTPTSVTLTAVRFANDQQGWAVGHGGVVLATKDGGESWEMQLDGQRAAQLLLQSAQVAGDARAVQEAERLVADGADKPFLDLQVLDAQRAVVVGAYGMAFRTDDAGQRWQPLTRQLDNPGGLHLYSLQLQGDRWLIAGEQGLVLLSTDGGASFRRLSTPYQGSFFSAAWQADGALLLAGLRGQLWQSPDLGATWAEVKSPVPVSFSAMALGAGGGVWLANQAGAVFLLRAGQLQPHRSAPLPPVAGLLALDGKRLLALTLRGASVVPMAGDRP